MTKKRWRELALDAMCYLDWFYDRTVQDAPPFRLEMGALDDMHREFALMCALEIRSKAGIDDREGFEDLHPAAPAIKEAREVASAESRLTSIREAFAALKTGEEGEWRTRWDKYDQQEVMERPYPAGESGWLAMGPQDVVRILNTQSAFIAKVKEILDV